MSSVAALEKPKATAFVKEEIEETPVPTTKRERSASLEEEPVGKKLKSSSEVKGEKQEDGSVLFDLTSKKQVSVRTWKNAVMVDIREYYDSNGEMKPTKKGISLTKDQWKTVVSLADDIDKAVGWVQNPSNRALDYQAETLDDVEANSVAFSISSKRRATVRKFKSMILIDFREYYDAHGTMKPGQKGVSLKKEQWEMLHERFDAIEAAMEELGQQD
ncbi:unnamed protein product [Aphanomyces euteiches]